jgi:hypothetical protein
MDKDIDSVEPDTYADRIVGSDDPFKDACLRSDHEGGTRSSAR